MRDYAKVSPRFWTGTTGKEIRAAGRDCQIVCLYLQTCASATMIGLYYLPLPTLCHETGLSPRAARAALQAAAQAGFGFYDDAQELVWVPEMACWQVDEALAATDKRVKGIVKMVEPYLSHRFGRMFVDRYREAYHLEFHPSIKGLRRPSEAPSEGSPAAEKPLRSQEQEQKQEKEQEQEQEQAVEGKTHQHGRSVSTVPDPDQAPEVKYARDVFEAIDARRGTATPPASPADYDVVRRWFRDGIPLRVALRGIQDCSRAPHARYVDKAVREEHTRVIRALAMGGPADTDERRELLARQAREIQR